MSFHVGQKVVCVRGYFKPDARDYGILNFPKKGCIYAVRDCLMFRFQDANVPAIRLTELKNPICSWTDGDHCEVAFWIGRFRPVIERKTDIAIFTRMLMPNELERT